MPELLSSERGGRYSEARQHGIVVFSRRPTRHWTVVVLVLALLAWLWPWPWALAFVLVAGGLVLFRVRLWLAERVILTSKRIIHTQGVLETARTEAWLRLDRISGMRITETFVGSLVGYATIHVEAPGDHPGLKRLFRIKKAHPFYRDLRDVVMNEPSQDPDESGTAGDYVTEELPTVTDGHRYRRHR